MPDEQTHTTDVTRTLRADDIFREQHGILAGLAAQITAMNANVSLLNHNIRQTCDRLDRLALEGHKTRIEGLEDWRKEMGARLDSFMEKSTSERSELHATVMALEHRMNNMDKWRASMFGKVIGLMAFAATITATIIHFMVR